MAFAGKRESRYLSRNGEFSGEKREFIAKNSLIGVSTQIERISNLISSYVVRVPKDNSLKNTCVLGILGGAKKSKKERFKERWER
jgi:hypothetical protein